MDTDEFDPEPELRDLYHSPGTGFRSIESLYKRSNKDGIRVTKQQVKNFLRTQETCTKTKPKIGRKVYIKTIVGDLGQQLQLDLVDMTEDRKYSNEGYRWILTSIEVFLRYAFTERCRCRRRNGKDFIET